MGTLVAALLVASTAVAAPVAPPAEWRADRWPDAAAIDLEREVTYDLTDPRGMLVTSRVVTGIVHGDRARRDLARVSVTDRPICREVVGLEIAVHRPDGATMESHLDEMVWSPLGDHPLEPSRSTREGTVPRRGIVTGGTVEQTTTWLRRPECFGGALLGRVSLGGDRPRLVETVRVVGPASGSWDAVVDRPGGGELVDEGGARVFRRELVDPVPDEEDNTHRHHHEGRILVWSAPTPPALGLRSALDARASERATAVLDAVAKARKAYDSRGDATDEMAAYVAFKIAQADDDSPYWSYGFEWGERTRLAERPLMPLEWWAVGWALLRKHGATPLLYDGRTRREPADPLHPMAYHRLGFWVPDVGVVLPGTIHYFAGTALPTLAGKAVLRLDVGAMERRSFEVVAADETTRFEGSVRLDDDREAMDVNVTAEVRGSRGAKLARSYRSMLSRLESSKKGKRAKRKPNAGPLRPSARRTLRLLSRTFGGDVIKGSVTLDEDDPAAASARLRWKHAVPGAVTERGRVLILPLPLSLPRDVLRLRDLTEARRSPVVVRARTVVYSLRVKDPGGMRSAGLPAAIVHEDGPVRVAASFARDDETRETLVDVEVVVDGPLVPAAEAVALRDGVRALRALERVRLVYEPEE